MFKKGSLEDLDIFTPLSGAHEQTEDCNCFPNCLFERRATQLVWGVCSLLDLCLTIATYLHEYFRLAFSYIRVCDVSASVDRLIMFALSKCRRRRVSRGSCRVAPLSGNPSGSFLSDAAASDVIYGTTRGPAENRPGSVPACLQGF